jgi:hypothetical protein
VLQGLSLGLKHLGCEPGCSHTTNAEVKKGMAALDVLAKKKIHLLEIEPTK